jgi:hypothetical protein
LLTPEPADWLRPPDEHLIFKGFARKIQLAFDL